MITAIDRCASIFIEKYRQNFEEWAKDLSESSGLVVAISRKGPRLLELLVREQLLSPGFLRRVTTELALPFIGDAEESITISDDGVWWGSTFNRVFRLAGTANALRNGPSNAAVGLPFAMSKSANTDFVSRCVSKHFLTLDDTQVGAFVNAQTSAFRLLGRPFDIEHPVVSFAGDFNDKVVVSDIIQNAALRLGGRYLEEPFLIPMEHGSISRMTWAILLETPSLSVAGQPQLVKLRVYLDAERQRLTVAAMQLVTISQESLREMKQYFPDSLGQLWETVINSIPREIPDGLLSQQDTVLWQYATEYSTVMWAAFLNGMLLLRAAKDAFCEAFENQGVSFEISGPSEDDLRLLVGPKKAKEAERMLANFLTKSETRSVKRPPIPFKDCVFNEVIPDQYEAEYLQRREPLLNAAASEGDVDGLLRALFHAQHMFIEVPSRNAQTDPDDRLVFGICLNKLKELVRKLIPMATDEDIHWSLDRLIDEGCIVPRYLRQKTTDGALWVRMFRVGEGPVPKLIQTVRLLFIKLSHELGAEKLPRLLFEKYCVLALSNAPNKPTLEPLRTLSTFKRFHLYGARQALTLGHNVRFLLDWARDQKILLESGPNDEAGGEYILNHDLEASYPNSGCPWDEHLQEDLEDLAAFTIKVANKEGLGGRALVCLTSVATPAELKYAIEAELDLWLHDRHFSVYHAIQTLGELAQIKSPTLPSKVQLDRTDHILSQTANFSAQVAEKVKLSEERTKIWSQVGATVKDSTNPARVWRGISQTLESRLAQESQASGFTEILSALRIAYATNRLLRDLLACAGHVDPKSRSEPMDKSIEIFRNRLNDRKSIDPVILDLFTGSDGKVDVDALARDVKTKLPCPFPITFNLLLPIILQVASRCEDILQAFGSEEFHETPIPLDPPQYILMWDIRGSSQAESREDLDRIIERANTRLLTVLGSKAKEFHPESRDDGNGLVCVTFESVLQAFRVLVECYTDTTIRAGVEVNMQGRLNYFPISKVLGGRAFEHAARITAMFKEINPEKGDPNRWSGAVIPPEPQSSYLVVGEFARRYAEKEGTWPPLGLKVDPLTGQYTARVHHAIPVTIQLVVPAV